MSGVFRMDKESVSWLGWKKELRIRLEALAFVSIIMSPMVYNLYTTAKAEECERVASHQKGHPQHYVGKHTHTQCQ